MSQRKIKLGWEKLEVNRLRRDCGTCKYGSVPFGGPNCVRCGRAYLFKWWPEDGVALPSLFE